MTREEALAVYHPIRASVRRILGAAISLCNQSDLIRAAKRLGLWADGKISLPEGRLGASFHGGRGRALGVDLSEIGFANAR